MKYKFTPCYNINSNNNSSVISNEDNVENNVINYIDYNTDDNIKDIQIYKIEVQDNTNIICAMYPIKNEYIKKSKDSYKKEFVIITIYILTMRKYKYNKF
jgi:hypothetical protein